MSSVTIVRPVRRRPHFHRLRVASRRWLTGDALVITFEVPPGLREAFTFLPGQHVTLRANLSGAEVRRSYSLCSTPRELSDAGLLRVGIRVVAGGLFSGYVRDALVAGCELDVMPPLGRFGTEFAPERSQHYGAVVAGSGITPVLSLVATGLATEPASRFTVFFGNRTSDSVMFVDELADLKDRYPNRLHIVHVLSREKRDAELLCGRLDVERFTRLRDALIPPSDPVAEWFLCGPFGMVEAAREVLLADGAPPPVIHQELFFVEDTTKNSSHNVGTETGQIDDSEASGHAACEIAFRLDGRVSTVRMGYQERILDRVRRSRPEVPFSCTGGVCGTCRAKVTEGQVRMERQYALDPDEVSAGFILTCQASPVTQSVAIDYDG